MTRTGSDPTRAGGEGSGSFAILDALPDAVFVFEAVREPEVGVVDFRHVHLNATARDLLGASASEVLDRTVVDVAGPERAASIVATYATVLETGCPGSVELASTEVPDAVDRGSIETRASCHGDLVVVVTRSVFGRGIELERLREAATHDLLTGLANRSLVIDELERALAARRRGGRDVVVVMVDLDHFKEVNDALGHAVGDRVLAEAAERMRALVRSDELLARVGGDEFVVVIRDLADPTEVDRLASRLLEAFREPIQVGDAEVWCTLSIGVARGTGAGSSDGETVDSLLGQADTALYAAKAAGRDCVAYYDEALQRRTDRRASLELELAVALERGEFEVYFQPEVDLATGETSAVEALLRWNRSAGEVLAAADFLAVAEETGAIVSIGSWAISMACEQVAQRVVLTHPDGSAGTRPTMLRVNVSGLQLVERHFADAVEVALERSGLAPELLTIEFDEAALERGGARARRNLERLRRRGVGLVLDDFGSGVASIGSLVSMPFVRMKVDRSLIANDGDDRMLQAVLSMARHLDLPVIAEGVESAEQVDHLRELGCVAAQGYYFGMPGPISDEVSPPDADGADGSVEHDVHGSGDTA